MEGLLRIWSVYVAGTFQDTVDFNPGEGEVSKTAALQDLLIHRLSQCYPNSGTDVIVACDSYTWIDGITYTESKNAATFTLTNACGNESIVTLDLTINKVSDISTTVDGLSITATNSYAESYQWLDCNNGYR